MRKPRRSAQRGQIPEWLHDYLERGIVPEKGSEARQQYDCWVLMPGYSDFYKLGWPDPPQ